MRVSREISLGSSLHRASTDALINFTLTHNETNFKCYFSMYFINIRTKIPGARSVLYHSFFPELSLVRGHVFVCSLNGQLVLAGGVGDTRITVWDSGRSEWVHPYPPMRTGRAASATVGYQNYLIVACGFKCKSEVDVLDSSSCRWYRAQPVPVGGHSMSSVVVGDCWYLSSFVGWKDRREHIFWAHLPTLTSSATSAHTTTEHIWHELPTPPVERPTLLALQGHLLLVGGGGYVQEIHRYDQETGQWRVCGQLPVGMSAPCCAVLPSGDLMVAGRRTRDTRDLSKRMWIAKI